MKLLYHSLIFGIFFITLMQRCISQRGHQSTLPIWTDSFDIESCQLSNIGQTGYFILNPSYQLVYEGIDAGDTATLVITVLNETEKIGDIETRVIEERELVNGQLLEVSRNFFAI